MKYYKIIQNNMITDIATENDFLLFNQSIGCILSCDSLYAHYLQGIKQKYYYDNNWMRRPYQKNIQYEEAEIYSITKEEYDYLREALQTEISIIEGNIELEPSQNEEDILIKDTTTIDYIRSIKLKEMSYICNKTITGGFDIQLSDGNSYHFSLTTQDQLNLITLATMVESGETQIPYHADGEPCKFYSTLDMKAIIDKATEFKTYHTSYYNSLKTYINSMETMEEISEVTYGMEIPEEYQSEVLKSLNLSVN